MTNLTKWQCTQRRLGSAWASTQYEQSLRCALNGELRTQGFFMRTAKTLIKLDGCPGWSESSLGAQLFCWFCHEAAHFYVQNLTLHALLNFLAIHFTEKQQPPVSEDHWLWWCKWPWTLYQGQGHSVQCQGKNDRNSKFKIGPHHAKICLREFLTRYDSNQPAHLQKLARILKLWIEQVYILYYLSSEQQRCWSDCADAQADLYLCCSHIA